MSLTQAELNIIEADQLAVDNAQAAVDAAKAALDAAVAAQDANLKTLQPDVPPVVAPTLSLSAGASTITAVWAGGAVPTKVGRDGTDSGGTGPWDTSMASPVPTFTAAGSWTFTSLVPGKTYNITLTYPGGVVTKGIVVPATAPPLTSWPAPSAVAAALAAFPTTSTYYTTFAKDESPTKYLKNWYGKDSDLQNGTPMDASNVSFGPNGLGLTLAANRTGGLINTAPWAGANPGILIAPKPGKPVYIDFTATLPAMANNASIVANWVELWLVGQNWPVDDEFDIEESLSGGNAGHLHFGAANQSIGWNNNIGPGKHRFEMYWSVENGAYFIVDGNLVEHLPASDIDNPVSPQCLIFGNSLAISAGVDESLPATAMVQYTNIMQAA